MAVIEELEVGTKVRYVPEHGDAQNGIVKSHNEYDKNVVFVVYNCGGDWDNYQDYTGASTRISDLHVGWEIVPEDIWNEESVKRVKDHIMEHKSETVKLDEIRTKLDELYPESLELERGAIVRVINALAKSSSGVELKLEKHNLTMTFLYNNKVNKAQLDLVVDLESMLNNKIQKSWDVSTSLTGSAE